MSENNNKPKIQLPSRAKKQAQTSEVNVLSLARQWADLHAKPKTRDQMDELLVGLPEDMQRKVILCGQRIAAGLPPKVVK